MSISDPTSSDLQQCTLHEAREHLRLVLGSGGARDLALEAGVGHQLDGELEHEAVGVLLRKLVEELSPCGELDHLLQPRWNLQPCGINFKNLG